MAEKSPPTKSRPAPSSDAARSRPNGEAELRLPSSSEWDLPTKRTVLVILLIGLIFVVWISRPILPMLVVSGIIAYLLSPIVDLGERLRLPRTVMTLILFVLLVVLLVLLPIFFVPILIRQLASIANFDVQGIARSVLGQFNQTIYNLPDTIVILGIDVPINDAIAQLQAGYQEFNFIPSLADVLNYIQQVIITTTNVVSTTAFISFSVVGGIFQLFITILIVFFLSLYLTKDAPAIRAYVASLFPSSYQSEVVDLFRRVGFIWSSFFRGQIILSFVVGLVTYIVLSAVGMPGALLLAILAGFLEVIPNLGPTIAMIPAVVVALIQGSPVLTPLGINNLGFALIVIAIYFIIQQLENNILVPRIIGSSVNLHPIVVICGVAVGFNIFGILGALLAAPTIASMRVLGSYIHAKLLGYEPFLDQRPPPRRQRRMTYRRTVTGDDLAPAGSAADAAAAAAFSEEDEDVADVRPAKGRGDVASSAT